MGPSVDKAVTRICDSEQGPGCRTKSLGGKELAAIVIALWLAVNRMHSNNFPRFGFTSKAHI